MATIIRPTANGRTMLDLDGCSDYYGGATVQGSIVCRISLPPTVTHHVDVYGEHWLAFDGCSEWPARIAEMAANGQIPGARVYEFRRIQ